MLHMALVHRHMPACRRVVCRLGCHQACSAAHTPPHEDHVWLLQHADECLARARGSPGRLEESKASTPQRPKNQLARASANNALYLRVHAGI